MNSWLKALTVNGKKKHREASEKNQLSYLDPTWDDFVHRKKRLKSSSNLIRLLQMLGSFAGENLVNWWVITKKKQTLLFESIPWGWALDIHNIPTVLIPGMLSASPTSWIPSIPSDRLWRPDNMFLGNKNYFLGQQQILCRAHVDHDRCTLKNIPVPSSEILVGKYFFWGGCNVIITNNPVSMKSNS